MITKKRYREACIDAIPLFREVLVRGQHIYLYGAGNGGKLCLSVLQEHGIPVEGFIDRQFNEIDPVNGVEIYPLSKLDVTVDYIIITLFSFDTALVNQLYAIGFQKSNIYVIISGVPDGWFLEDTIVDNVSIGRYTYGWENFFTHGSCKSIGRYCSINYSARIYNDRCIDFVTSWPYNSPIFMSWEEYKKRDPINLRRLKKINLPVEIGNDVWIGANAVILSGVKIGDGSVIGAGAIVTKDVPEYAVVVGTPAKVKRYRFDMECISKLKLIKWWNWDHEKVLERCNDFCDIETFVEKYYNME